jgi:hypothetical protein
MEISAMTSSSTFFMPTYSLKRAFVMRFEEKTHVFIIRIWHEPREGDNKKDEYRGTIENIGTKKRVYFNRLQRMVEIIQDMTGWEKEEFTK